MQLRRNAEDRGVSHPWGFIEPLRYERYEKSFPRGLNIVYLNLNLKPG